MVLSTWLPDGSRSTFVLHDVLHIPALRVNLLSVPKMLADSDGKEVFFSGGAKVLQDGILVGYSHATGNNNDLYPLLCTLVSGSVRGGEAHPSGPIINAVKILRSKTALMNLHPRLVLKACEGSFLALILITFGVVRSISKLSCTRGISLQSLTGSRLSLQGKLFL